jgi:hypothetical protein
MVQLILQQLLTNRMNADVYRRAYGQREYVLCGRTVLHCGPCQFKYANLHCGKVQVCRYAGVL